MWFCICVFYFCITVNVNSIETLMEIKWARSHVEMKYISELNLVGGRTQRFLAGWLVR